MECELKAKNTEKDRQMWKELRIKTKEEIKLFLFK